MASALYEATFVAKKGATVKIEVSIVHPHVDDFGTDHLFAWKLIADWVSPSDDSTEPELARKYIKRVELSPLRNATVARKTASGFTVKRKGTNDPKVTYTIEVTDAALLAGIKKGDSDEIYDVSEHTAKPRKASAAAVASSPTKTWNDLRRVTLELVKSNDGTWSDSIVGGGMLQRWACDASDKEIEGWLGDLRKEEAVKGAALIAADRARAGDVASAKHFLAYAEAKHESDDFKGMSGLVSAWWQFGKTTQATKGFQQVTAGLAEYLSGNHLVHTLVTIAALGGAWDEVTKLIPKTFDGSGSSDEIVPALLFAFAEGKQRVFDAIMKRWMKAESDSSSYELSFKLARACTERGTPERYLELVLAWHNVIDDFQCAPHALAETEKRDPARAVAIAERLLADDRLHSYLHCLALAILTRHAPKRAAAWATKHLPKQKAKLAGWSGQLAALGRTAEARTYVKAGADDWYAVASVTTDRALAIETLVEARDWVHLADLGETKRVEAELAKDLARITRLPPKKRDHECRSLGRTAAMTGHAEIAFAAVKLPGPAVRRYTASALVRGFVSVGDYTNALRALELVPDDGANARVGVAFQDGLRVADEDPIAGDRAVAFRVA